jgi:hypothetical protein
MGTWSAEPFGNDTAADWGWELDDRTDWEIVMDALNAVLDEEDPADVDADSAVIAIAAAEAVAHHRGWPTQSDPYTESVAGFVCRAHQPPADAAEVALKALDVAANPSGELAELWAEGDPDEWTSAIERLREALSQPSRDLADLPVSDVGPDLPQRRSLWGWLTRER